MNEDLFDRQLMDEMAELPPEPVDADSYNPWRAAVTKIMWGMALNTFKFEFFYLQYLLPLLGAVLMYLGYRSLREENKWFKLCWGLSGCYLVWHALWDVLAATPLFQLVVQSPANLPLTALGVCANLFLLYSLRAGLRAAFASTGEPKPTDWLGFGLVAQITSIAIAVWCDLIPLTEPSFFGMDIIDQWELLYYARGLAFIALQIYLLVCIARQSEALAGRGYHITPVPVRISARALTLCVFGAVLLAIPPALWLGGHVPTGPVEELAPLTAQQTEVRDHLVELGLPEELAHSLDGEELALCAEALAVRPYDHCSPADAEEGFPYQEGMAPTVLPLADGRAELDCWAVELPGGQLRYYYWFRYLEFPSLRLQELFSVDPIGNYPTDNYRARLIWEKDGITRTVLPQVKLAGGQTAEELSEDARWWYEEELKRLGHLHYSPWFDFSIPRGAEEVRGYLSYTADVGEEKLHRDGFYDSAYVYLRHQDKVLHYPFQSISDLGGSRAFAPHGPISATYALFIFNN